MWTPLVECIPNISEGRDRLVIEAIAAAAAGEGRVVVDVSSDVEHHRSVLTIAGEPRALVTALRCLTAEAVRRLDLRGHHGVHPRMGVVDVIPFVPLRGATIERCVALAQELGVAVGKDLEIPVYLYGAAATRPERRNLATVRRGGFEGFTDKLRDPLWRPDYGPCRVHPTAGATAVGAREVLIAYNVNLATSDPAPARAIAATVREAGGGLPAVRALGLPIAARGCVQVSMNLTDYRATSVGAAFERVRQEAEARGVGILDSEIVGLAPRAALDEETARMIRLRGEWSRFILEDRIEEALGAGR